jgi:microsomal dipeptidase-like Zn-dependent dipeptidase
MYADFMGFPFPQHLLMRHTEGLTVHPCAHELAFLHATSVPPTLTDFTRVITEHRWFKAQIERVGLGAKMQYGLQNPPTGLTHKQAFQLADEGVKFMCLSYFEENEYGGGFHTPDAGLTAAGEKLIASMVDAGIVIDLSHAGHQTARDALDLLECHAVRGSVVATHSACFATYPHLRNLPDDVLRRIADRDGLDGIVGLPTMTWLLDADDNTIEPFMQHLEHLIDLVGETQVAIGSDGVYATMDKLDEAERFAFMNAKLDPTGAVFHARLPEECSDIHGPERMRTLYHRIAKRFGTTIAYGVTSLNLRYWRHARGGR